MSFENIRVDTAGGVAVIEINRPAKLNALSKATLEELGVCVGALDADAAIGAVIITGADTGRKPSFVAGADIGEMREMGGLALREHARLGQAVGNAIETGAKPYIAAINGFAFGGGLELAMSCHIRYAAKTALMGQPEVNLGLIPGFAGTQRLVRLVGRGRALEMLLTGDPITADEAFRMGLVNKVCDADALLPDCRALAMKLAAKAPVARALILDAASRGADLPLAAAQQIEADLFGVVGATDDVREGLSAFLEKRAAVWTGK